MCSFLYKQTVLSIIDKLRKHRQSWPFLEPVDQDEVFGNFDDIKTWYLFDIISSQVMGIVLKGHGIWQENVGSAIDLNATEL